MLVGSVCAKGQNPKREFRGAWLHTVGQMHYTKRTTAENQAYLISVLDSLQAAGCNAIVWQVRPKADAYYPSELEPWSMYLSGTAGVAPEPLWDPLQFMIDDSHKRGMELHAWLNPYRVTNIKGEKLPANHIYHSHPEWFSRYGGMLYFNPALQPCRDFICEVVKDIVTRYDIDAIHMDDYFYPYPIKNQEFPDEEAYLATGDGMDKGDWRRANVDKLIKALHEVLVSTKPWVRFGISPFGIWRNQSSDPRGSKTNGLQCYDALFADVLKWTEEGWVDYQVPQLYWELEHKAASSEVLAYWWNEHANGRHMYYGQSVTTTMNKHDIGGSKDKNQLAHKVRLSRELENVQGNCWWPGYSVCQNYKGVYDELKNVHQSTKALVPEYPWLSSKAPGKVRQLKAEKLDDAVVLMWKAPKAKEPIDEARFYVIYRFGEDEIRNLADASKIVGVTSETEFAVNHSIAEKGTVFVVTALSRTNIEGPGQKVKM